MCGLWGHLNSNMSNVNGEPVDNRAGFLVHPTVPRRTVRLTVSTSFVTKRNVNKRNVHICKDFTDNK